MTYYTATYSPDDNKLRLYATTRLDAETYAQAKAHGFRWAPKQELFVAPMWTPQREDFLLTLVDEIEDEDKSLVERQEERAERFEEYSERRAADADSAHRAVSAICDNIPFGQPILIGHHSEKRARRDAEKIENGMARAVKMWDTSKYWESRAAGALHHAKYKELPTVRARRIKGIEADKRGRERDKAHAEKCITMWNIPELDMKKALTIANFYDHISGSFPLKKYPRELPATQYEGSMSFWSALNEGVISPEQARDMAIPAHKRTIAWSDRWIAHFDNRLTYEKAMLAEQGALELIAPKARPKQPPLLNYRAPEGMDIENQWRKGEFIHYSQKEMTKAEYSALYDDYKGTRTIDGHRVRIAITSGQNYSRNWNVVFLTDSKEHARPVESVETAPGVAMIETGNGDTMSEKEWEEYCETVIKSKEKAPEPVQALDAVQPESQLLQFEPGKTYYTRSTCDHNCIYSVTIASRTAKTVTTDKGKKYRPGISRDGKAEILYPHGRYSMAACISAGSDWDTDSARAQRKEEKEKEDELKKSREEMRLNHPEPTKLRPIPPMLASLSMLRPAPIEPPAPPRIMLSRSPSHNATPLYLPEPEPQGKTVNGVWYGAKCDRGLSTTDIAKRIRADLKEEATKNKLFTGSRFSVRKDHHNSLRIEVLDMGFNPKNPVHIKEDLDGKYRSSEPPYTPAGKAFFARIESIVSAYNFDGSDMQSGYFHVNFYSYVYLNHDLSEGFYNAIIGDIENATSTYNQELYESWPCCAQCGEKTEHLHSIGDLTCLCFTCCFPEEEKDDAINAP